MSESIAYTKEEQIAADVMEGLKLEIKDTQCECTPDKLIVLDIFFDHERKIVTYQCTQCGTKTKEEHEVFKTNILKQ